MKKLSLFVLSLLSALVYSQFANQDWYPALRLLFPVEIL